MLRFRGFRASLNFSSGKRTGSEYFDDVPTVSMSGAYRRNTESEEFSENRSFYQSKYRPSMVALPPTPQPLPPRRSNNKNKYSKSANDLTASDDKNSIPSVSPSKSTGNVSSNPEGQTNRDQDLPLHVNIQTYTMYKEKKKKAKKKEKAPKPPIETKKTDNDSRNAEKKAEKELKKIEKEQKKLEKKQLEEQKKREKLEAQEQAKQEKLRKETEKAEAQRIENEQKTKKEQAKKIPTQKKENDKKKNTQKPNTNPLAQGTQRHSTNTLESSISKTSAPPPYSETNPELQKNNVIMRKEARRKEVVKNVSDGTGNTSFGKPVVDTGSSWDMVSQHRQQISRTAVGGTKQKIVTDSQYVTGRTSLLV